MQEEPPPNYSYIFPDVLLPGTRWIDNHKPVLSITLDAHTTVHPQVIFFCLIDVDTIKRVLSELIKGRGCSQNIYIFH